MGQDSPWDQPWSAHRHGHRGAGRGSSWTGGPPPWVQGLINLAQSGGQRDFGPGRSRGPRARRGDVRAAILDVLAVEPMNGYQIIQQIAERSGGAWKPSPGSVYPTVQQLEDEGLVEGREGEGRRLLQLTEEGRRYVEEHPDELAATWRAFEEPAEEEGPGDLKPVIGQVMGAVWQVVVSGTQQQRAEAAEILAETRRKLYGLLAEGDSE
jgi:DNA-binding PadR family transcriptional regulator